MLRRRNLPDVALKLARSTLALFPDLLPVTRADMAAACGFLDRYPELPTRDAVHAATVLNNGLSAVISSDKHFQGLVEVRWIPLAQAHAFSEEG